MTPTETAAILRKYREWLCDTPKSVRPHTRQINEALDVAIEMIERMEKLQAENDELRTKIEAMERQEPVACVWRCDNGHIHGSCEKTLPMGAKLYARTGAQPSPSVPVEAIGKMLADAMAIAVSNGANSVSMPDEYVEVAVWLRGISPQPLPSVPEGWQLVPVEPTPGMIDAAEYVDWGDADVRGSCINAWHRMRAAAPEAES